MLVTQNLHIMYTCRFFNLHNSLGSSVKQLELWNARTKKLNEVNHILYTLNITVMYSEIMWQGKIRIGELAYLQGLVGEFGFKSKILKVLIGKLLANSSQLANISCTMSLGLELQWFIPYCKLSSSRFTRSPMLLGICSS